jgi:hypothetical protein
VDTGLQAAESLMVHNLQALKALQGLKSQNYLFPFSLSPDPSKELGH